MQAEYEQLIHDSGVYAFDLAHQLAFRKGLGNSLFASPHTAVDHSTAVSFAKSSFAPSNIAVYGSNIDAGKLSSLVGEFFTASGAAGSLESQASKYYGGEVRVPATAHAELDQLLVAFKGAARSEVEYAVLALLLGGEASVKWGQGATPLAKLHTATSSAKAFNAAYSDAGLFGISVQAKSADVADVASKAVAALKQAAQGVSDEALKQAVAKAKFAAAAALETKAGQVAFVGEQVASGGKAPSLEDVFAKLDKVSAESLAKVRSPVTLILALVCLVCADVAPFVLAHRLRRVRSRASRPRSRSATPTSSPVRLCRPLMAHSHDTDAFHLAQTPTRSASKRVWARRAPRGG